MRHPRIPVLLAAAALAVAAGACAHQSYIPGTTVADTDENKAILRTVDQYRERMLEKNVDGLLVLASEDYFEDGGTPRADDDYGYEGLRARLTGLMSRVRSIRYEIQYKRITVRRESGKERAYVDAFLNGSFELSSDLGDKYHRVNDVHQFVLQRSANDRWKFVSGM